MDEQEKICERCGQAYSDGQNFCSNCGMYVGAEDKNEYFLQKNIDNDNSPEPIVKPKRKTYKANKIASLVFAIVDIFLAIPFWICAVIFQEVSYMLYYDKSLYDINSTEYMLSEISDIYYVSAGACYFLAILFVVGSMISWIMFFIYSKKRREFKLSLKLEEQETQESIFEEAEEVTEESEEQTKEKEPQIEIQGSQNQE
jgi:ribosomal protein L37E/uncharacterized membrane protein YciS (DUF1049 family)